VKCFGTTDGRQIIRSWERQRGKRESFKWGESSFSNTAIVLLSMSQKTAATEVILLYSYTPLEALAASLQLSLTTYPNRTQTARRSVFL